MGQIVGCFLALMVILLVRDNCGPAPARAAQPVCLGGGIIADHHMARRKENHLPALYRQIFCC